MRIAFVLPEFPTEKECGGLGVYHDNIARLLANAGHSVTVFVKSEQTERVPYDLGITVERVFVDLSKVNPDIPGSFMREWSRILNQTVREYKGGNSGFDLIQYSNIQAPGFDRLDIPTVVRISSDLSLLRAADQEVFNPNINYFPFKISDFLEEIALIRADAVYCPSYLLANIISKRTGCDIRMIESPFYPREVLPGQSHIFQEELLGKSYILTFGTLKILKGAKLIGDSIHRVLADCPDLYWVFAGAEFPWKDTSGSLVQPSEYIRNRAGEFSNRVVFLGKLPYQELHSVIENASFCVMPSRIDNLPNTCIEAMALGKVVIGTTGASFEQLIENGKNGFLIERENTEMLISKIKEVAMLPVEVKLRIEAAARARIEKMQPNRILEELLEFYKAAIQSFPRARTEKTEKYYRQVILKHNQLILDTQIDEAVKYLIKISD